MTEGLVDGPQPRVGVGGGMGSTLHGITAPLTARHGTAGRTRAVPLSPGRRVDGGASVGRS